MKQPILYLLLFFSITLSAQWSVLVPPGNTSTRTFNAVFFIDAEKGFVVGGHESNDSIQTIIRTSDGGENWEIIKDNPGPWLTSVQFVNSDIGYAIGYYGTIIKTTDGGETWQNQSVPENVTNRHFNSVSFVNESNGYVCGGLESNDSIQTILKTTDGGNQWEVISDELGTWLRSVFFLDEDTGFTVGYRNKVLKTTDGGESWQVQLVPHLRSYHSVFFLDQNTGFAVGGWESNDAIETILKTTDGGENWLVISDYPQTTWLRSLHMANYSFGLTVGCEGKILKTTDGGESWDAEDIIVEDNLNAVYLTSEKIGYLVGENGTILKYDNPSSINKLYSIKSIARVYPNPTNGFLVIELKNRQAGNYNSENMSLAIMDIYGNDIMRLEGSIEGRFIIDTRNFRIGCHHYVLEYNTALYSGKFIVYD